MVSGANDNQHGWQEKVITLFEVISNLAFYIFALFIIIVPPLKWLADLFPSTDNGWWVLASAVVFVIVVPILSEVVAHVSIISIEKIKKGEFLAVIFKPLKSVFAVISIYGVLVLEYKVIHGQSNNTLFDVYFELLKSL